jgi:hypothetical protein
MTSHTLQSGGKRTEWARVEVFYDEDVIGSYRHICDK